MTLRFSESTSEMSFCSWAEVTTLEKVALPSAATIPTTATTMRVSRREKARSFGIVIKNKT
jgi:hypothetical protein